MNAAMLGFLLLKDFCLSSAYPSLQRNGERGKITGQGFLSAGTGVQTFDAQNESHLIYL